MKVYLAGNVHTNWRAQIVEACPNIEFLQPYKDADGNFVKTVEGETLVPITHCVSRDLMFVRRCDVVFIYLEKYGEHSRHHGTMIELGYAKALSKLTVIVTEMGEFDMAFCLADVIFCLDGMRRGIEFLKYLTLKNPI